MIFQLLEKSDWNGEPRGYKIYYQMKEAAVNWSVLVLDNGVTVNSAILPHLEEWMEYEVKMLAYNDVGNGVFSTVTVERTREAGMWKITFSPGFVFRKISVDCVWINYKIFSSFSLRYVRSSF